MPRFLISFFATIIFAVFQVHAIEWNCTMQMNFDNDEALNNWRATNDGVMGGRSSGGLLYQDGHAVFSGVINTNGGGFSSVRSKIPPGRFENATGIKLRMKSDGRQYKITMRTNTRYGWRPVSFQADIQNLKPGEWGETTIAFSDLNASVFGRQVRGTTFDKSKVKQLGIILADGQDGPFRLEIEWVKVC